MSDKTKNTEEFYISWKSILEHLWLLIFAKMVFILFIYYRFKTSSDINLNSMIFIFAIGYLLIFLFPMMILFLNYLYYNRGANITFNLNDLYCSYFNKQGNKIDFHLTEIRHIKSVKTPNQLRNNLPFIPWDHYNYSIITLNDGKKLIITSLLIPELQLPINSKLVEEKAVFSPFVSNVKKSLIF